MCSCFDMRSSMLCMDWSATHTHTHNPNAEWEPNVMCKNFSPLNYLNCQGLSMRRNADETRHKEDKGTEWSERVKTGGKGSEKKAAPLTLSICFFIPFPFHTMHSPCCLVIYNFFGFPFTLCSPSRLVYHLFRGGDARQHPCHSFFFHQQKYVQRNNNNEKARKESCKRQIIESSVECVKQPLAIVRKYIIWLNGKRTVCGK